MLSLPIVDQRLVLASPRGKRENQLGTVGLGERSQVVRLRGESFGPELRDRDYVGAMVLGPGVLKDLPDKGCLIGDLALPRLRAGREVHTLELDLPFQDIGDPAALWAANLEWLRIHGGDSWCDASAEIGPLVQVTSSLIGPRAKVSGEGLLDQCLVLRGAQVRAPLRRAIVLPSGKIMSLERPE